MPLSSRDKFFADQMALRSPEEQAAVMAAAKKLRKAARKDAKKTAKAKTRAKRAAMGGRLTRTTRYKYSRTRKERRR